MDIILTPPNSPILFNIFNLQIRYYGVIMAFSIFCGIFLSYFLIKKRLSNTLAESFLDDIPYVIFFAILGARLFYVIGEWEYYVKNPIETILLNHGGLSIWGAILFGIISALVVFRNQKDNLYKYLDIFALVMPLCQAIGRWGNFFNQEAYGRPTNYFIKLYVDYKYRYEDFADISYYHPAFLYESVLNFALFVFLIVVFFRYKNKKIKDCTVFYLYLIFYSIIRIFVESIRIDSILYIDSVPVAQVISFIVLIIAVIGIIKNQQSNSK